MSRPVHKATLLTSKSDSRSQSLASAMALGDDTLNEQVDVEKLYHAVLKVVVLQYTNEARFHTPINRPTSPSKYSRSSRHFDSDVKLPSNLVPSLESRLNLIAMKNLGNYDELTRRSLLRLYTELLDPEVKAEITRVNKPEYLVMKFVSCANKELVKITTIPQDEVSDTVFKQADVFVQILISLIHKDRNSEAVIAKLKEHKESLKPTAKTVSPSADASSTYVKPSYRVSDMDPAIVLLVQRLFEVDQLNLQQDVFKVKDVARAKTLHKDVKQIEFYLLKDLGQFTPRDFVDANAYASWKSREVAACDHLKGKFPVLASDSTENPPLPQGESFYVFPPKAVSRKYFTTLIKLCLSKQLQSEPKLEGRPFYSKQTHDLITQCARIWRIDYPTRVVALYTASHLSGMLKDPLTRGDAKELGPVDLEKTVAMFHMSQKTLEEQGKMDWEDKHLWPVQDQEEWVKNLTYSYNEVFFSIKDCLKMIFNKSIKPKFGPYLAFLGEYLESDSLFQRVEMSGITKKWEKKLSKALLRISELRYAELLANLPRDDTLNTTHILDISDSIVGDIKLLQKRYKQPLLGFLNVSRTVAAVLTGMFALDSKNILKHIDAYARQKQQFIPYGDALEAYKSLAEIRSIHGQVSNGAQFKFDLENFFYPFLASWVEESGEKMYNIIQEAFDKDDFQPVDIEDRKYSSSVLDIFTLVREFFRILNNLNWANEFQLAQSYTSLLKSISDGVLLYCTKITDKVVKELLEEPETEASEVDKKGWFDEVKNVVNNMQSSIKLEEPYNFKPETCTALNNINAMMEQLTKLEESVDPEAISATVARFDTSILKKYTSHIFSLRLVRAENLRNNGSNIHPYVTLMDTRVRRTIGRSRTVSGDHPDWDEEFEITLAANTALTVSLTVWDEKVGTHSICGRSLLQLDPKRFKHDGVPQETFLDLDSQGRVLVEIAVESERVDAIFVLGRAHRSLKRCQERIIKLVVEKFSTTIHVCFSRANLRSVCGNVGQLKPTQDQMDDAMMPLYNYLNMNLQVLAEFLTKELLLSVMVAAWNVVVLSADELLLPRLASAKTFQLSSLGSKTSSKTAQGGWQSAVSSAMANVTNSIGISGFGKSLTINEIEAVFSWLNFLCFDFFHNDGNGPPVSDLKTDQYQALLLVPVYYDRDVGFLELEVERLSPAFIKTLRERNNFDTQPRRGRAGSVARRNTILANATAKAREQTRLEESRADPIAAQTLAEDIILRLLLVKDEKSYVARRLEQRERLAHSIATERLARAAAEGRLN